ncbi:MAG: Hsp70 family protein [Bacteroidota bacterium]
MTINYGIDLGTTNSVIALFQEGKVRVFKDRTSLKDTVPSVVFFREDRVVVGTKAKERIGRDSANVYGSFKRKMGTSETYLVPATSDFVTPVDLSAQVLRYLKRLVEENIEAAIVTIPASFDTIQSNATKAAAEAAGLRQVMLLQEPIAASLAFVNRTGEESAPAEGRWLVYDLGGGTFDAALVTVEHGEMRVVDHEGNNFLGGVDFDQKIVEEVIIPKLEAKGNFQDLANQMKRADGKYNSFFIRCLYAAERAKIELSSSSVAEIELEITDDDGQEIDLFFELSRETFEQLIQEAIDETLTLIQQILERNHLKSDDISSVILVGGSTYIPYVRQTLHRRLNIAVDASVDPTTAVAIGAAYYAGTVAVALESPTVAAAESVALNIKMAYPKASQDKEVFWAAKIMGDWEGLSYQISRTDGGFDTGLRAINQAQLQLELPLVSNSYNLFLFKVYDGSGNEITTDAETIGITHGKYHVEGQPLPQDICLEVDDPERGGTKLDCLFARNMILPMRKTKLFPLNKELRSGVAADEIVINVVEGPQHAMPEACQSIGYIKITGADLYATIPKHSDLEITCRLSESRDLEVTVYFERADQEFKKVFTPQERHTPVSELLAQARDLDQRLGKALEQAETIQDFEGAKVIHLHQQESQRLVEAASALSEKDVSDKRYQLEDRKRKLAIKVDELTRTKRLESARHKYRETKEWGAPVVRRFGDVEEQKIFRNITEQEPVFLAGKNSAELDKKSEEIKTLVTQIWWRTPELQMRLFLNLSSPVNFAKYRDASQARQWIQRGQQAIDRQDWHGLAQANVSLLNLLPPEVSAEISGNRSVGF